MFYIFQDVLQVFNDVSQCFTMFSEYRNDWHRHLGAFTISNCRIGDCQTPQKLAIMQQGSAIMPQKWSHAKLPYWMKTEHWSNSVPGRQFPMGSQCSTPLVPWFNHQKKKIICTHSPLEFFFQEQSYSSLHSGRSLAWDHVRGDIDDSCGAIADFCGVVADPCGAYAIGGRAGADAATAFVARLAKHKTLLNIVNH